MSNSQSLITHIIDKPFHIILISYLVKYLIITTVMMHSVTLERINNKHQHTYENYRNVLTRVIISLARSLARSGLMKHDNPDKARPASYWF